MKTVTLISKHPFHLLHPLFQPAITRKGNYSVWGTKRRFFTPSSMKESSTSSFEVFFIFLHNTHFTIYFSIYFNNLIRALANLTSPWLFLTFKPQISFHLWVDSLILIPCLKSFSFQLSGVIPYALFFSHLRKIPKVSPHWVFQLISLTSFFFYFPADYPFKAKMFSFQSIVFIFPFIWN